MRDIFDELTVESPAGDIFDEIDYTPETQGFGDLKVAERDNEKTVRRNALLEEQKRARFDTSFGNENLRALETGEQLLKGLTTPVSSAIHGIRQATGLEDPNNPLEIVPQMQGLKTEEVQRALPYAMPGVPQTIAGLSQAGAGIGNFLLSPDTIGLGGVGGAGKAIQAAAGSVFSGDMAAHMPEQAERLGTATIEGKGEDIVREGALTTLGALGTVAPIAHASLPKSTKAVEEKFKVERPGESEWSKVPEELKTERKDVFDEIKPEEIKAEETPQIPAEPQRAPDLLESRAIESGKPEDAKRFAEIDDQMKGRTDFDSPEFQSLFAEREAIKNRNGGMPPKVELEPELIGMGGAVESEFKPVGQTATSIKNAAVDSERQKRGLPPAIEPARRSFGTVWDEAMATVDRDPGFQDRLIDDIRENPRALTDLEDALLLHRQIDLQNEHAKATRDLAQAYEDGRQHAVELEMARVNELNDKLKDIYDIGKRVGTETGRGLNARKMLANEDFSLASLSLQKQAAVGGRKLTPAETVEIQKIADEYKAKNEALEKALADKDQRLADLAAQQAYEQMKRETQPSAYVIQVAEKIVAGLEQRAKKAEKDLQAIFARTSMGVDPTILLKVSEIAAYHIARHGLDFAKWSADAVSKFGDNVKPYLEQAWEDAQKLIQSQSKFRGGKKSSDVEKIVKKSDSTDTLNNAKERNAKGEKVDLHLLAHKLGKQFLSQGIKGRVAITDAVHNALKEIVPDITRDDAMDALSGYGKFKQLSKDEIDVELRDLKGQLQQEGKLRDMQAGHPPKMSGVEQRKKSDEERRLEKLVEEAKRRGGYVVTDPATQLKTTLDAIKTRLLNEISDFDYQIETRQKLIKNKRGVEYDAEAKALKEKRDERKKVYDEIFGKPELTGEQLAQRALSAVERSISEIERKIKENDLWTSKKQSKTPLTIELQAARSKRDALNEHLEYLRDLERPKKTPQERAAQADKTRKKHRIAELEDKLSRGDFSKNKPIEFTRDKEAIDLKYELERIKRRWNEGLFKDKLKNRTPIQKVLGGVGETINTARAIMTSIDLSAIGRQANFVVVRHPIRAVKAMGDMFRAMKSEEAQFKVMEEIYNRPNAPLYQRYKLALTEHGTSLSKMEEAYMSRWAEKIPGVAMSQRAYTTFLNRIRADSFDAIAKGIGKDGVLTPEQGKIAADYINVATGRGNFGAKDNLLVGMNTVFFAPRLVASRFQIATGMPLWKAWKDPKMRNYILSEYAGYLAGVGVIYALAKSAGFEVNFDSNSSDFGKIKIGNTRIDPLGGLSQVLVLMSRYGSGKITKLNGQESKISRFDTLTRFGRTKLAPVPAAIVDIGEGKNVVGKKVTPLSALANAIAPMTPVEIVKAMKEHGVPEGTALGIVSALGFGVSTYTKEKEQQLWQD